MIEDLTTDDVYIFSDPLQALTQIKALQPDVVFTDIVMEGMDGLTLIEAVTKILPSCRFVIISGFADFEYARQAILLGVNSYLLKPIERSHLKEVLQKLKGEGQPMAGRSRRSISEEALEYIRSHSEQPISIPDIAANIHIAPNYLSNVFKKETGISVADAIRSEQIKAAERLLRNTNLYLYEIAEKFGYKDVKYFSMLFKEHYHTTPKNYRKKYNMENDDE